jgi:hypothetical protein
MDGTAGANARATGSGLRQIGCVEAVSIDPGEVAPFKNRRTILKEAEQHVGSKYVFEHRKKLSFNNTRLENSVVRTIRE